MTGSLVIHQSSKIREVICFRGTIGITSTLSKSKVASELIHVEAELKRGWIFTDVCLDLIRKTWICEHSKVHSCTVFQVDQETLTMRPDDCRQAFHHFKQREACWEALHPLPRIMEQGFQLCKSNSVRWMALVYVWS